MKQRLWAKWAVIGVVLLITQAWGAAPAIRTVFRDAGEKTVDSQLTGNWEPIDSIIPIAGDSADVILVCEGQAELGPGDVLYIAAGNDSANRVSAATAATTGQTHENLDTLYWRAPYEVRSPGRYQFRYVYKYAVNAANTDTFYINAATGANNKPIKLYDVSTYTIVLDKI